MTLNGIPKINFHDIFTVCCVIINFQHKELLISLKVVELAKWTYNVCSAQFSQCDSQIFFPWARNLIPFRSNAALCYGIPHGRFGLPSGQLKDKVPLRQKKCYYSFIVYCFMFLTLYNIDTLNLSYKQDSFILLPYVYLLQYGFWLYCLFLVLQS